MTDFILPPDLAGKFAQLGDHVRVAPQSEKLTAFGLFARHVAGLVGSSLPHQEAVDRLQAFAEGAGLAAAHGDDVIQEELFRSFENPIFPDPDFDCINIDEERPPEFSDDALADRFAKANKDLLRFVAVQNRWYRFVGDHWRVDDTLQIYDMARRICRHAANQCEKEKVAVALASAKTVAATVNLARADRRLAARVDDFDIDPWQLNTPAGVLDLRSGKTRPHEAADLFTKITAAAPNANCPIINWLAFLARVTNGDGDLIDFLQRVAGYALTGITREQALFFFFGTGANGKSTFINVLTGCLGAYHRTSGIETFTASTTDRHPTDLAALVGARLVTAVETEEGRRWAESKIKGLTGGDRIAARFMRQDFFEFTPVFKLIIAGNHRPSLRSVDEAIRRRFHLVPFTVTVPPAERDERLGEKLQTEWPGILSWMIAGCAAWQRHGLAPPSAVKAATASYLEAEDTLGCWVDEAGDRDPDAFETTAALFQAWRKHAGKSGEYVGSIKKFSQRLEERGETIGLSKGRDREGRRGFFGLRLPTFAAASEEPAQP